MLYITMGGMLLLFSILITASALTIHKTTLTSFHLRFERIDLIDSLIIARDQTERKNEALRKEVQQRENAEAALREAQMLLEEKVNIRTAELQTANNRLEDANRELSDFTHSVSHDLRTPLLSIDNFGTILEEESGYTLNESAKEALFFMRKATHRMQELINDLLVLAKASRMELSMEPVDMSAIVLEIISTLRADQTGRNVELVVQPGI
jgi:light-regulated signal transduction histidine kinase (bacteriophytochrome)